jgi:broad specificity phosphatase PhoE
MMKLNNNPCIRLLFLLALTFTISVSVPAWSQTIYLVRHGEKVDESRDPALSLQGQRRAVDLALHLRDAEIKKIYVSEFQRTQKTAEVLATQVKVTAQVIPAKEIEKLVTILKSETENVLIVAHSNTLPDILKALGAVNVAPVADNEYDRLVVLQMKKDATPSMLVLRY